MKTDLSLTETRWRRLIDEEAMDEESLAGATVGGSNIWPMVTPWLLIRVNGAGAGRGKRDLEVDAPPDRRAVLLHVEHEAVKPVTVLVVKIEIPVANIDARPVVESVREGAGQDGHQV